MMAEQLYVNYRVDENGNQSALSYAYGEPWVAMALYMGDISHPTEAEAREAWRKWKESEHDG